MWKCGPANHAFLSCKIRSELSSNLTDSKIALWYHTENARLDPILQGFISDQIHCFLPVWNSQNVSWCGYLLQLHSSCYPQTCHFEGKYGFAGYHWVPPNLMEASSLPYTDILGVPETTILILFWKWRYFIFSPHPILLKGRSPWLRSPGASKSSAWRGKHAWMKREPASNQPPN